MGGVAGAGKSFLAYSLALGIATGTPVLGFAPPRPFRVAYFDQENQNPDRREYQKWAAWGIGLSPAHLPLIDENFHGYSSYLGSDSWHEVVEEVATTINPEVMIFDTANSCFAVEDENDNAEAIMVVNELRRLAKLCRTPASLMVLKHARLNTTKDGKDTHYRLRGASAWSDATDGTVFQVRPRGDGFYDSVLDTTLYKTRLHPGKVRAHGLKRPLGIRPKGIVTPYGKGLRLQCGLEVVSNHHELTESAGE